MEKHEIYLDFSAFVELKDNSTFRSAVHSAKNKYEYYYSPAYLEEVANILRANTKGKAMEYVQKNFEAITELTDNNEYLPGVGGNPYYRRVESPSVCYNRVMAKYDVTIDSEKINNFVLQRAKFLKGTYLEYLDLDSDLNAIDPKDFLKDPRIVKCLDYYLSIIKPNNQKYTKWKHIRNSSDRIELHFEQLFNFIETTGYHKEDIGRGRNYMNDVTHALYGTNADYFLSLDQRQIKKVSAVYSYFGVPTVVANAMEFFKLQNSAA